MQKINEPAPLTTGRAVIIGETNHKVDLLQRHLAEYFSTVDLLSDLRQLNSPAADAHAIIVVTDTSDYVLNHDFFLNLRSIHPRAGLLCLVDYVTRETEKAMRNAGVLFLGSYDHFDDCYGGILQTAVRRQKENTHQPF